MASQIQQAGADEARAEASHAREVVSYDPATGEEVGRAPLCSKEDVALAVERGRAAQKGWGALCFRVRAGVVMRARALVTPSFERSSKPCRIDSHSWHSSK